MDPCLNKDFPECKWRSWLWATVPVVEITFGTIGNILNILILSRKRLRKYSTTVYLLCLAFADIVTLWASVWPNMLKGAYKTDMWQMTQVSCKSIRWITHSAAGYSIWLLVLLAIERLCYTKYPLIAKSALSRRNSFVVAMVLLFCAAALPSHYLFGYKLQVISVTVKNVSENVTICEPISTKFSVFYQSTWPLIIFLVYTVVPVLIIVTANMVIMVLIIIQQHKLARVYHGTESQTPKRKNKVRSSTKMIFLISGVFILTTLPYTVNRATVSKAMNQQEEARQSLVETILVQLLYCNFALNFLLYVVSGTIFKQEWQSFLCECRMKLRNILIRPHRETVETHQAQTLGGMTMNVGRDTTTCR